MEIPSLTSREKALLSIWHHPGMIERSPADIAKYSDKIKAEKDDFLCGPITIDIVFLREIEPEIAEIDLIQACPMGTQLETSICNNMDIALSYIEHNLPDFINEIEKYSDFRKGYYKEFWVEPFLAYYNDEGIVIQLKNPPGWERKKLQYPL